MQQVGARRVFVVDLVVHSAAGRDCRVEAFSDEVDGGGGVHLAVGKVLQGCRRCDRVAASVGHGVQGTKALGNDIAERAGLFDDLIELAVKVAKVAADQVPMSLLALQGQLRQVD